ncbi:metallophosphoesterase family protein [Humisphaera borealis]|nr:metallophosphoesterase [Humisphaera borealis]
MPGSIDAGHAHKNDDLDLADIPPRNHGGRPRPAVAPTSDTTWGDPRSRAPIDLPDPLDDFEFPPELQLPSMEDLLTPPALREVAPAIDAPPAPPAPTVVETPTPLSERTREDPDASTSQHENPGLRSTSDAGVRMRDPSIDDVRLAELPAVDVPEFAPPQSAAPVSSPASAAEPEILIEPEPQLADVPARAPGSPTQSAPVSAWAGVLFIGDLHLAHRVPGFRRDDYPRAILQKLRWAIEYAKAERLLPVLLGDLFDFPRDNANWLLVELHHLLDPQTPAIYGNHDCKENTPGEHDTVSILVASGLLRLLSAEHPWTGVMNGCRVFIGGTCWGQKIPWTFDREAVATAARSGEPSYVLWATHHDLRFPGFEEAGRMDCREVKGVDLIVNGHIHRELHDVATGRTRWMNPGSLCRIARSDASREHVPGVLRVDVSTEGLAYRRVTVPHLPFDEVFHPDVESEPVEVRQSLFIRDLEKLQSVRTTAGVGLREFLASNLDQFEPAVSQEIRLLAEEVLA